MSELATALQLLYAAAGLAPMNRADHERVQQAVQTIHTQCVQPAEDKKSKDSGDRGKK
jgi:hypothetical protein